MKDLEFYIDGREKDLILGWEGKITSGETFELTERLMTITSGMISKKWSRTHGKDLKLKVKRQRAIQSIFRWDYKNMEKSNVTCWQV